MPLRVERQGENDWWVCDGAMMGPSGLKMLGDYKADVRLMPGVPCPLAGRNAALEHDLVALRRQHPVLRRRQFFYGRKIRSSEVKDLSWFRPDGKEMTEETWHDTLARCIGLRLAGDAIAEVDAKGNPILDDTLLILLNAHHETVPFTLPAHRRGVKWELLLDTRAPAGRRRYPSMKGGEVYGLEGRCLAVLQLRRKP